MTRAEPTADTRETPVAPLGGQVALITGCGRLQGIGAAVARLLASLGADVAVTDIAPGGSRNLIDNGDAEVAAGWEGLPSLARDIEALGRGALTLVGDVGASADVEAMVTATLEHFGRIDILVNNAAAPHGLDRDWTWLIPEDAFDRVMQINTKGVFMMSSAVARHMLGRGGPGRIVNIASNAGRVGIPKRAAYCASKFAVIGLTQVLAAELAPHGVTVNAVCPGSIETSRFASTRARADDEKEVIDTAGSTPVGRVGVSEDVAAAVAYLVSPAANFVTGQTLGVDGGVLMR